MKDKILGYIKKVEQERGVRVLLAVESGSRAWGFESQNSDWDVRFIYVHKPKWYFTVEPGRDVIEIMDGNLDLVGWELRKALGLLKRSNPSLLEWLNSPIVYYAEDEFMERVHNAASLFYNPIASMYHYNHLYAKHNERYLQREDCDMKRFLYYLRGVLVCKWIDSNKTLPPVAFKELVAATVDNDEFRSEIDKLVRMKKRGEEHDVNVVDGALMEYAHKLANHYNEQVGFFRPEMEKHPSNILDDLLFDMVNAHK